MAVDEDEPRDLLVTAFELIAEEGWSRLSLVAVARRAGVAPAEVYRELPSRGALLAALSRRIDEAMLEVEDADLVGLPPRDRVFELMMARLEALVPFRPGLARLARSARGDPCLVLATALRLERSLAWLQDAAGLRSSGLRASLARRALGAAATCRRCGSGSRTRRPISAGPWPSSTSSCGGCRPSPACAAARRRRRRRRDAGRGHQ